MQALTKSVATYAVLFAAVLGLTMFFTGGIAEAQCNGSSIQDGVDCIGQNIENDTPLTEVIQSVINTLLFVIGIISVIMLIIGGIRYVISGGNQSQVEGARNTILYAIVGLVVAFVAWGAVNFVITALSGN